MLKQLADTRPLEGASASTLWPEDFSLWRVAATYRWLDPPVLRPATLIQATLTLNL
jgi:hypothetical protein